MLEDADWKFLCNEVLSLIEIEENRLLDWGFVNAHINLDEDLEALIQHLPPKAKDILLQAQQERKGIPEILSNLKTRCLVIQFRDRSYSSRFAQTVRNLFLLRQLMPNKPWQSSPSLVSDMRIHLQRRRYPDRIVPVHEVITTLQKIGLSSLQEEVFRALLQTSEGEPIDLANFQKTATRDIVSSLKTDNDQAVVVGAGTGSGKTKAFYLPAMAHIVTHPQPTESILVLALYPRTELLKDQADEAFREARKLDELLQMRGQRKITIGIYYGDTPEDAASVLKNWYKSWKETNDHAGYICPYVSCPKAKARGTDGDKHEMVWSTQDLRDEQRENEEHKIYGKYARLRCLTCGTEITADTLLLTREQMLRRPPDILFTSTEMLNRRMSRVNEFALFGVHTPHPPRMVLLDEIHTYEGIHGAQVAYLIRRWRAARRTSNQVGVCIVGLSATLMQPKSFFSRFTGIPEYRISYVTPSEDELVDEGMEYNLVLKGDPVSQTSLLSTSVQTVMLLARMLDVGYGNEANCSKNAFGSRVFAFADTLDVVNRWAHIEKDAEETKHLARLRKPPRNPNAEDRLKYEAGQLWPFCVSIGHKLEEHLSIGVVSSQNKGVENKDVVLATSALEVGFNDPKVGAVIQHKAPRDFASLLQRKGRAGRDRGMRPWMVIVTSDYGRDRWAFQHSEQLFDPLLPPLEMPVENYYVQKIQACLVLMDWIGWKLRRPYRYADLWKVFSPVKDGNSQLRQDVVSLLRELLKNGDLAFEWINYMRDAMQVNDSEIHLLLWGEPRSLLLEVIPTMIRKLETNWRKVLFEKIEEHNDGVMIDAPMPEFVPSALFANLNLVELHLKVPHYKDKVSSTLQLEMEDERMDMIQGINEFAPGHVNKRFAKVYNEREAHWLALPVEAQLTRGKLPLDYLDATFDIERVVNLGDQVYTVLRPVKYTLGLTPKGVLPTSTGRLEWRAYFQARSRYDLHSVQETFGQVQSTSTLQRSLGTPLPLTPFSAWRHLIPEITAYNQTNGEWIDITRFAPRVTVETRWERAPQATPVRLDFEWDDGLAGIGYTLEVDGLHFTLDPLDINALYAREDWHDLYRTLKPEYFRDRLREDRRISERGLSYFTVEWLYQIEKAALTAYAIGAQNSLEEAAQNLQPQRAKVVKRVMDIIFQSLTLESGDDEADQPGLDQEEKPGGRLFEKLRDLMTQPEVVSALQEHESIMWRAPDTDFERWLLRCYYSSMGAVIYAAICRLVPDVQPEDLLLDIDGGEIWISETVAGGVGLISRIADHLGQHPRDFELLLMDAVRHCDREHLSHQLAAIIHLVDQQAVDLAEVFAEIRKPGDLPTVLKSMEALKTVLEKYGMVASRELIVALNARLLRPNSNEQLDHLVSQLVSLWKEEEQRLGCTIDLRVIAVTALRLESVSTPLEDFLQSIEVVVDENQKFNILQSLLWLDCQTSCPDCIQTRNRFQEFTHPSRRLLLSVIEPYTAPVVFGRPGWMDQSTRLLSQQYQATISFQPNEIESGKQRIMELLTVPVEVGFQLFYPYVERIDRKKDHFFVTLALRELMGA